MDEKEDIVEWLEKQNPVSLLQDAIRCNTVNPPGNELALALKIQKILNDYGIPNELYPASPGRANLIARINSGKHGKRLVFSGHLDTVAIGESEWDYPPFAGECVEGRMYGRGTSDMKGGLYSMLLAFSYLHERREEWQGECLLAVTFGEETGGEGAKRMMCDQQLPTYDSMIIAEPTAHKLVIAHKGVLWVKIKCYGKNAHASMPQQGMNAICMAHDYFGCLQQSKMQETCHPLLSQTTFTVTKIQGGEKINVVPDYCEMTVDIRTNPSVNHSTILVLLQETATRIAGSHPCSRIEVETLLDLPAVMTSVESSIVRTAQNVLLENGYSDITPIGANYFTDGSVFSQYQSGDILIMGPGIPELAHQTNEYIEIADYKKGVKFFYQIAAAYLSETDNERSYV
ncbi:hypothetical protein AN963_09950 [Brevibacillus choshinensis]|uniref:Peptidase M20 dimerisation domain-containing protein n=1 Tax=Brevibacillus choshinensis TaxID=54911 RepID=A0ABR5NF21_BRECH|nr:M20 family metallopeptidase [Brevibacillus choshinensis]KQL49976.1 hypothetical protein AN963_09950 [Brevibacillus choshinensis]